MSTEFESADVAITRGGPKAPVSDTPPRRPGSVRRTTTIDSLRPDGIAGRIDVTARARDLLTPRAGGAVVLASEGFTATLTPERALRAIEHPDARLASLVGVPVMGGFRGRALQLLPDQAEGLTLLNLLLDDLPGASLVAGYAMQRDPSWAGRTFPVEHLGVMNDLCAGWAGEATLIQTIRAVGSIPVPTTAAVAATQSPATTADVDAWHERPDLPPGGMRRARRLDLVGDGSHDGTLAFDVHFRDSYRDASEGEGAVHEYGVHGRYDAVMRTIVAIDGAAHVLPWTECPRAMGSVGRVAGSSVDDIRARVRTSFVGTSTCTHLNDVLRSLADLPTLAAALARNAAPRD